MKEKILVPLVLILGSHTIMADAINDIFKGHKQKSVSSINEQPSETLWSKKLKEMKTGQLSSWGDLK